MMITTLSADRKKLIINRLVVKDGSKKDIEYLHNLYSKPDFELGYIQHGSLSFHREKPPGTKITEQYIHSYDAYTWGENGLNGSYPVNNYTTKAKSTLSLIRQLLDLQLTSDDFEIKRFFEESSKIIHSSGILFADDFNLSLQVQKLEHILKGKDLALSLLKDAYFDFYLFVDLLTRVNLEAEVENSSVLYDFLYDKALENTELLDYAIKFSKLK